MNLKEMQELINSCEDSKAEILSKMNDLSPILGSDSAGQITQQYASLKEEYDRYSYRIDTIREIMDKTIKTGRPSLGIGKTVKITLPEEEWTKISQIIEAGQAASVADYFRQLHQNQCQ
ncbi:hypothetical protein MKY59_21460 [Paenibacillus sp. FSL W8-0426]|uniref:hypothetical protein n=1 Tax=Paenibacillus sp. FSL W8-0426 TaxID=2921714 RepID=UPI0030DCCAA2